MRKLATVRQVRDLLPIEGADRIELALVDCWKVVVSKGLNIGDKVVYCEIDSFLPVKPEFEFLRKSSYKKLIDGSEGFRLKTVKLRGQISQGLCIPVESLIVNGGVINGRTIELITKDVVRNKVTLTDTRLTIKTKDFASINYKALAFLLLAEKKHGFSLRGDVDAQGERLVLYDFKKQTRFCFDTTQLLGMDVSDMLEITKYDPDTGVSYSGDAKGSFPSFLQKTDEERIQNLTREYQQYLASGEQFYATEKLDGSSATFYLRDGEFGVCSRNIELKEGDDNPFWRLARELDIEQKLKILPFNACLQGELIGEGVQGNSYKVRGHMVRFFNLFNIDTFQRLPFKALDTFCKHVKLLPVPSFDIVLPKTIDELLLLAEGKSLLNSQTEREGLVIRNRDSSISFKVISNKFLLKN